MWHEERHARIRDLLSTSGKVSVERIVTELGVSRETIRRDLVELAERGEIRRAFAHMARAISASSISKLLAPALASMPTGERIARCG